MADQFSKFANYNFKPKVRADVSAKGPYNPPESLRPVYERYRQMIAPGLAEKFKGITAHGDVRGGLFPRRKTGISLQPVVDAARAYLAALSEEQRKESTFAIDDIDTWRRWSNIHPFVMRHGVCLDDASEAQRELALGIVAASMSASGYRAARDVMKLNYTIAELCGRWSDYGEWVYWMSIFGSPSLEEPWGWQIDGHHLIINCFVLGDEIVLTPHFMGSEPVVALEGKYKGTTVFQDEEEQGLAFMKALSPDQRKQAIIGTELAGEVFTTPGARDNMMVKYEGIPYGQLSADQQAGLLRLIELYVGRIRPGHSEVKLDEVKQYLGETYFAWIGQVDDINPFYYRIHSPVVMIEFDHCAGVALSNEEISRNHIHTLVRTPNGNDYGRDLLRQHYEQHDHSHPHTPHRMGKV